MPYHIELIIDENITSATPATRLPLPPLSFLCFANAIVQLLVRDCVFSRKFTSIIPFHNNLYALFSCICTVIFGRFLKDVGGGKNVHKE